MIDTYKREVEACEDRVLLEHLKDAKHYNEMLFELKESSIGKEVVLNYEEQLNVTTTGMMGHIEIPKINVNLPIYHGTSEAVLTTGIGHLEGSSLPVGGENTHAILTGHCGLPSAELFTRLDELRIGDEFVIYTCHQKLKYKITNVQVVEPDQVDVLKIENDKDLVSLITCTPYGINTHRLIVTGERIEELEIEENNDCEMMSDGGVDEKIYYVMGFITLFFLLLFCRGINRKLGNSSK